MYLLLSFFSLVLMSFFIPTSVFGGFTGSDTYSTNLRIHIGEDISHMIKTPFDTSTLWTNATYAHTRDTSSNSPNATSSYSGTIGADQLVDKWMLGFSGGGDTAIVKNTFSPYTKTHNRMGIFQPYISYALRNYLTLFSALGITRTYGNAIKHSASSHAHTHTTTYFGTGGILVGLPSLSDTLFPTFRILSTYTLSKTNSYQWESTSYAAVRSHMATLDPALRLTFTALKGSTPYIEYAPYWIIDRSKSISQEPKDMGQAWRIGSSIHLNHAQALHLSYTYETLTTPGDHNSFTVRFSYAF